MILKENLIQAGQIHKPHGVNGEMSFSVQQGVFDQHEVPCLILLMDGIPVPFFVESFRMKSDISGLMKLEGVISEDQVREFSGAEFFVLRDFLKADETAEIGMDFLVGYTISDTEKGIIGVIAEIDQTTENALFVIPTEDDEILIPIGDEYIREIDHDNKTILLTLPEGLLDL
jgi:16S rRNA processing protein RimM